MELDEIKATLDETKYVDKAIDVIENINVEELTTTKIRNLLSLINIIYNEVQNQSNENFSADIEAKIQYLRLRFAYEAGRDTILRDFVNKAGIFDYITQIKGKRSNLLIFCKYMEALVAYHRFNGGKD